MLGTPELGTLQPLVVFNTPVTQGRQLLGRKLRAGAAGKDRHRWGTLFFLGGKLPGFCHGDRSHGESPCREMRCILGLQEGRVSRRHIPRHFQGEMMLKAWKGTW